MYIVGERTGRTTVYRRGLDMRRAFVILRDRFRSLVLLFIFQKRTSRLLFFLKNFSKKIMPEYVIILRVNTLNSVSSHMTVAFLGETPYDLIEEEVSSMPRTGKICGETLLGPKNDIPVWLVRLEQDDKANLNKVWKKYNVEQAHTRGLTEPLLHITKKENLNFIPGDTVEFDCVEVKMVGGGAIKTYYFS